MLWWYLSPARHFHSDWLWPYCECLDWCKKVIKSWCEIFLEGGYSYSRGYVFLKRIIQILIWISVYCRFYTIIRTICIWNIVNSEFVVFWHFRKISMIFDPLIIKAPYFQVQERKFSVKSKVNQVNHYVEIEIGVPQFFICFLGTARGTVGPSEPHTGTFHARIVQISNS